MRGIQEFAGKHDHEDIYVLGSGASLNYLDQRFFRRKIVVAVNDSARIWGVQPDYIVVKEHEQCIPPNQRAFPDVPIIASRYPYGGTTNPVRNQGVYAFDHLPNAVENFDASRDWPTEPDSLVVSWSTITSAMHFAAYLGADNIIMVGHDCGHMGDEGSYVRGYPVESELTWLTQIEAQSRAVKLQLTRRYGCRVYGLSPFISPDLEGVRFIGQNRINADGGLTVG